MISCPIKLCYNDVVFMQASDVRRIYRGSYMSAHVLLNLLNVLRKRDQIELWPDLTGQLWFLIT